MKNRSTLVSCFLLVAVAMLAGCDAFGILAQKLMGNPPVDARYVPAQVPTLVLAESSVPGGLAAIDAEQLTRMLGAELTRHRIAPVIDASKLPSLRDRDPQVFAKMSLTEIGAALGAQRVLHVDVCGFDMGVATGSDVARVSVQAKVRYVDVAGGRVLYPADSSAGQPVGFVTPPRRLSNHATAQSARSEALAGLTDQVGKLFRKWQPEYESARPGELD